MSEANIIEVKTNIISVKIERYLIHKNDLNAYLPIVITLSPIVTSRNSENSPNPKNHKFDKNQRKDKFKTIRGTK